VKVASTSETVNDSVDLAERRGQSGSEPPVLLGRVDGAMVTGMFWKGRNPKARPEDAGASRPANLRLLSAFVAGAFTASGCATTYTVPAWRLSAVAGLPDDRETEIETRQGWQTVKGSTRFTLVSVEGTPVLWTTSQESREGSTTASAVPLSALRREGGALVLSETGQTVALDNIWSAEFTKAEPGQTAGLVAGVVVIAVLVGLVAAGIAYANSCSSAVNQTLNHP